MTTALSDQLREAAQADPHSPFNPHWHDTAKRLMRQAADAIDAANEALNPEKRL